MGNINYKNKKLNKKKKHKSRLKLNIVDKILFMAMTLLVILSSGIIYLHVKANINPNIEIENTFCKNNNYEISKDIKVSKDSLGIIHLKGTLKNTSNKDINFCQIEYNLYDKNKDCIGTAVANVNNIKKNTYWDFEANCMKSIGDLCKFEISNIIIK